MSSYTKNLMKAPKKDTGKAMPHFQVFEKGYAQQADLIFLPDDKNYKYSLVVVDLGDRKTDAVPLKTKQAPEIISAFNLIYKRGILTLPDVLTTDAGSEFKGDVKKHLVKLGIRVKHALPGRHRQVGMVEKRNGQIGTELFVRMHDQEFQTGVQSNEWIKDLPKVVKELNKKAKPTIDKSGGFPVIQKDTVLLEIGTKVRRALDEPRDVHTTGKKLHGRFRATDLRWDPAERTIENMLINAGHPPVYILDGDTNVAYTKTQLQVIDPNETKPTTKSLRGDPKFIIKKILNKKTVGKKVMYQVQWNKGDPTWEPRTNLIKDVPDLIKAFTQNQ